MWNIKELNSQKQRVEQLFPGLTGGEHGKSLGKGYTQSDRGWINSRKLICTAVTIVNSTVYTWNLLRESIFNALITLGEEKKKGNS